MKNPLHAVSFFRSSITSTQLTIMKTEQKIILIIKEMMSLQMKVKFFNYSIMVQTCKHDSCNFTDVQTNYSILRTLSLEIETGNIITMKDEI